ncbi:hypothetical protein ScPMuIL_005571 [Solemya velum]
MPEVVFLHPDLGIGGAERAVIDAALALKSKGHSVHFVTAHHDKSHCFQETKDGTLTVTSVGDWLPRHIFGHAHALCAYIRMIYAAIFLVFFSSLKFDVVFCDQISACIPVLRWSRAKILFYCHFPDMLLTARHTFLKKIYRAPIDWLEEKTTGMADCILVNSQFTAKIFKETFRSLHDVSPTVLYPIPDFSSFNLPSDPIDVDLIPTGTSTVFLSINRYERKKNLGLAISAFAKLKKQLPVSKKIHLIMAGGYDDRVLENKEHYLELNRLAQQLDVKESVTFLRSFTDSQKRMLLNHSTCLLYTPDREHFGIVPIEAMYMKCPVIAVKSGGPLETVVDGDTGYLCEQEPDSFAEAMKKFVDDVSLKDRLGKAGRKRVEEKFSFNAFTKQLNETVHNLLR